MNKVRRKELQEIYDIIAVDALDSAVSSLEEALDCIKEARE